MLEAMVTEWYRSLAYQSCARLRWLGWHRGGTGYELRQASLPQLQAHFIREGIRRLVRESQTREQVILCITNEFLDECRTRGLRNYDKAGSNMYSEAKDAEDEIRAILETFRVPLNIHVAAKDIILPLNGRDTFISDPVGILTQTEDASELAVYYIKVTRRWDPTRRLRLGREFRLMAEMTAAFNEYEERLTGAVVDVIIPGAAKLSRVQRTFVPVNRDWIGDFLDQLENQENSVLSGVQQHKYDEGNEDTQRLVLNTWFPQNRQACDYPYPCAFIGTCWGNESVQDAQFRKRTELLTIQGVIHE